jgi:Hypothetical protein (DUF2513)
MKRDMELIRALMLEIESKDNIFSFQNLYLESVNDLGYSFQQIDYNLEILIEAGLLIGKVQPQAGFDRRIIDIERLSWNGHEFIDNARNESVWKKAMTTVSEKGGSVSVGVLTQLLTSVAKQLIGLS